MKKIICALMTIFSLSAFSAEYLNVENRIKVPKRFLKQSSSLRGATLISDGVERINGFVVINNPRLKLKNEYKGLKEIGIASRNITVDSLCAYLGFGYWEMTPSSPFEEKEWGTTPKEERISVVMEAPTVASFRFHSYEEYDYDGVIKKIACKL